MSTARKRKSPSGAKETQSKSKRAKATPLPPGMRKVTGYVITTWAEFDAELKAAAAVWPVERRQEFDDWVAKRAPEWQGLFDAGWTADVLRGMGTETAACYCAIAYEEAKHHLLRQLGVVTTVSVDSFNDKERPVMKQNIAKCNTLRNKFDVVLSPNALAVAASFVVPKNMVYEPDVLTGPMADELRDARTYLESIHDRYRVYCLSGKGPESQGIARLFYY